uniref:Uncharacterized protein n=1 Tax=Physcomitrium patens TaxID=3218 RepID=A0A7I4DHP1_PHYPA
MRMSSEADGALDKTRRHKKRQLEDTLHLVMKKRKVFRRPFSEQNCLLFVNRIRREDAGKGRGACHVQVQRILSENLFFFNHIRRATAEEEERAKHPKPEDSVYFHPALNPSGAPPIGKPPMYKSSIGPRIPLSSTAGPSGETDLDMDPDTTLPLPPPPPPPPLPSAGEGFSAGENVVPLPLPVPVPPPPPAPPGPVQGTLPPPPPLFLGRPPHATSMIPPPPPPRPGQPLPPGISREEVPPGTDEEASIAKSENVDLGDNSRHRTMYFIPPGRLPPPPPPPRRPSIPSGEEIQDEIEDDAPADSRSTDAVRQNLPPPPPPPMRPPVGPPPPLPTSLLMRPPSGPPPKHPSSSEAPPPGVTPFRPTLPGPPLPPEMSSLPLPPPPPRMLQSGMLPPPGPPPGPPPVRLGPPPSGPPPVMRPPAGPPPMVKGTPPPPPPPRVVHEGGNEDPVRSGGAAKPSYVKSAAPTVVKRPLAQHTPELTSMVPASVRVRRENAPKVKPKTVSAISAQVASVLQPPRVVKPTTIDDTYSAFLEDMKLLGAFGEGQEDV